jgi:hypothetical protein
LIAGAGENDLWIDPHLKPFMKLFTKSKFKMTVETEARHFLVYLNKEKRITLIFTLHPMQSNGDIQLKTTKTLNKLAIIKILNNLLKCLLVL